MEDDHVATADTFVIVGGGLAGAKAAEALREQGFDGRVVLVGAEVHLPYERPPLSKDYLAGRAERTSFDVHDEAWFADHDVELKLGVEAIGINPAAHEVELSDGSQLSYTKLLLATGSSPRRLPLPGAEVDSVHYLRTVGDSERIKETIGEGVRLVVIGAGWIGLEVASTAKQAGATVTVLEAAELPLLRVLGPELAAVFRDLHAANGVDLRFGVSSEAIETNEGAVTGVRLADGTVIPADAVVVGIGAAPNTKLAEAAGLTVNNGVVVDASLRSSDPDVFAVGDIANAAHPLLGKQVRVEHWANALNQPAVAATSMLGGDAQYDELPYFFTDQFDLGMEYLGLAEEGDYDRVVYRGDVAAREFIAFWLSGNRIVAGMNVNVWDVTDPIKELIRSGKDVDPDRLADPDVPLDQI
ncbi:MAG TPA: FAD-dependent oxidoreductase [Pseudonocardiaceae bacterium]|nr:FAD-dependent oxidoreductase [Pseudonocardiaceae bacterium]